MLVRESVKYDETFYSKFLSSSISNPQYGTNTFGTRMPSGVWLFSRIEATLLGGTPCLEVVADRRGEAHIATAETEDVIRQLQLLEQALYVVEHFFQ